ncbi:MAG: 5,10-methylenetetrahydrofolate reductase, prokaryotic form [Firmicutes bacterium]|nr:5,10-methylenetetrahydrofolate reductase, prokaryotic form [Bacillota bacterium]
MKLKEVFLREKPTLSFEVFPPKQDTEYQSVKGAVDAIAALSPDFMSVTYGAGGGTSALTAQLAENIDRRGVTPLAHLTCVSSSREEVQGQLALLREHGVENILALRGDLPEGQSLDDALHYRYAAQLVEEIREFGGFSIGAA